MAKAAKQPAAPAVFPCSTARNSLPQTVLRTSGESSRAYRQETSAALCFSTHNPLARRGGGMLKYTDRCSLELALLPLTLPTSQDHERRTTDRTTDNGQRTTLSIPSESLYGEKDNILLSDNYLPGAMVLAHSLRDNGTKGRLAVLITPDGLQQGTIDELKTVYDDVIPIARIENSTPGNLYLMDRPDLISTFSKIALWKQTQYDQIVYIDADVIATRAPDELLTLDVTSIAAVPDIGWPDCFNTGVMVLRPNLKDYYSLLAFAQRGISFDGADQGLLNMHFKNWDRLSFAYNCTPSGHYQYIPAYRYFESTISLVHFIGPLKPWRLGRKTSPQESPYNQLLSKWWAVYDRHYHAGPGHTQPRPQYRPPSHVPDQKVRSVEAARPHEEVRTVTEHARPEHIHEPPPALSLTPGGRSAADTSTFAQPAATRPEPVGGSHEEGPQVSHGAPDIRVINPDENTVQYDAIGSTLEFAPEPERGPQPSDIPPAQPVVSAVPQYVRGEEHVSVPVYHGQPPGVPIHAPLVDFSTNGPYPAAAPPEDQEPCHYHEPQTSSLTQETREERPADQQSASVEHTASSTTETQPPERTPSPPLAIWDASRAPPPVDSKPEAVSFPVQIYTMSKDTELFQPPKSYPEAPKNMYYEVPTTAPTPKKQTSVFPWERSAPTPTRIFLGEEWESSQATESPTSSTRPIPGQAEWSSQGLESYPRSNAWDEVPEIEKYMRSLHKPRQAGVSVISGSGSSHTRGPSTGSKSSSRKSNLRLTHFPPEQERPSPAVTPALIMRSPSLSSTADESWENEELPAAEGVPSQKEWNPVQRLKELQRRQSLFLEKPIEFQSREVPKRQMPGEPSKSG
ncbi:glycogenin-2 [Arthroderma uncinatum]|uniref:glycogenin-2 n=1 Tax=Arthroderma uncinatum TaxID=74035 RepID=UPI00144AF64F|nr:glycogenin-2 [Arthroderma uncinatum]KAF3491654.1 glycogenin-2 [Arthroderma uncinatum]